MAYSRSSPLWLALLKDSRFGIAILLLICCLLLVSYAVRGNLAPVMNPDSEGYINFRWDLSEKGINGIRTPGYPLFLQPVVYFFGFNAIPIAQTVTYFAAVFVFHLSLLKIGFRPFSALAVSVPMSLGISVTYLGSQVLADSLALSMSILSMAAFAMTVYKPSNYWNWIGLACVTFFTYQVRPAYLFLLVLWPLLGVWIALFFDTSSPSSNSSLIKTIRWLLAYAAVSIIPFVSYAVLRGLLTGYFGLVAFGGYNFIGIAVQFLDEPTIVQLPGDVQPLAKAIVGRIAQDQIQVDVSSYNTMERNYPDLVHAVSVPEAKKIYGEDVRLINAAFNKLSMKTLQLHPTLYLRWIAGNTIHGLGDQAYLTCRSLGALLVLAIVILAIFRSLWSPRSFDLVCKNLLQEDRSRSIDKGSFIRESPFREFQFLFWLSTWYALGKTALIVLVEPSVGRYMAPASVLWPSVIALVAMHFLCSLHASRSLDS